MASEAHGVKLFWSTATASGTGATLSVGELVSFTGPSGAAAIIDVTNLQSSAHEKLQGLPDEGNIGIEYCLTTIYMAATGGQAGLRKSRLARKKGSFVLKTGTAINAGDPIRIHGEGYVTTLGLSGAVDDKLAMSATIEITGKTTID